MVCRTKCSRIPKADRYTFGRVTGGHERYLRGWHYCSTCETYVPRWFLIGWKCSCCGYRVRVSSRNPMLKARFRRKKRLMTAKVEMVYVRAR